MEVDCVSVVLTFFGKSHYTKRIGRSCGEIADCDQHIENVCILDVLELVTKERDVRRVLCLLSTVFLFLLIPH